MKTPQRPQGQMRLWVAQTDLADAMAPTVFETLLPVSEFHQNAPWWHMSIFLEAADIPEKGRFSIYASIEANPAKGMAKGDWFSSQSHDFCNRPDGPFQLTLRKL